MTTFEGETGTREASGGPIVFYLFFQEVVTKQYLPSCTLKACALDFHRISVIAQYKQVKCVQCPSLASCSSLAMPLRLYASGLLSPRHRPWVVMSSVVVFTWVTLTCHLPGCGVLYPCFSSPRPPACGSLPCPP